MSERERWIVYPLLFLALGAGLRDKLAKQTRAKQIVCEQLYVVDNQGRPLAELTGDRLWFDVAGGSSGYVVANVVDAQTLAQGGRPVARAGEGPSWTQLLRLLQQMGLLRATPAPGRPEARPAPPTEPGAPPEGV